MTDTKNFPPWTPKDNLVMWEMELKTVERLIAEGTTGYGQNATRWIELHARRDEAVAEVAKWKAQV
jgi:hypothetical protein